MPAMTDVLDKSPIADGVRDSAAPCRISAELSAESLRALIGTQIDLIHVPGFYPAEQSARFAERIAADSGLESYEVQNALKRLGMGYVDVGGDGVNAGRYHDAAMRSIQDIRALIYPEITPIDHLRLLLEEVWPAGAHIETADGRKCFVGTCRVIEPGAAMLPHNDRFGRMRLDGLADMAGQLAVNVYLQMPERGGEIELWLREPTQAQDRVQEAKDGLERIELGEPKVLVRPGAGDLVIFNSRLIHGVTPGEGEISRVTTSCFIGYRDDVSPLTFWS